MIEVMRFAEEMSQVGGDGVDHGADLGGAGGPPT